MTARVVGSYGTLTRSEDVQALTARTTLTGTLTVPAGTWRVTAIISDTCGASSTRTFDRVGAGTIAVDVDHMTIKSALASAIHDGVMVSELVSGSYVALGVSVDAPQSLGARPAYTPTKVGVQLFAANSGLPPTPLNPYQTWLAAMPPGLGCTRVSLNWTLLQPTGPSFDPTWSANYDAIFAHYNSLGLSVILTVGATPSWAGTGDWSKPPTNPATFAQWVDDIIDRWGSVVNILSIDPWNEPNLSSFYTGTLAGYIGILRAAHSGAAGRVPISLGSIAGSDSAYVESLFTNGLTAADFDSVDIHPYPLGFTTGWRDPAFPVNDSERNASLACGWHMMERVLESHGAGGRDYFISETGVSTNLFDTNPVLRMSDVRAATWIATMIDQAKRVPAIKAICIHEAVTRIYNDTWSGNWGLVDLALNRRAAWAAVAANV